MTAGGVQVDLFYDACTTRIDRWTSTDGLQFIRTEIPYNEAPFSVSAARGRETAANPRVSALRPSPKPPVRFDWC